MELALELAAPVSAQASRGAVAETVCEFCVLCLAQEANLERVHLALKAKCSAGELDTLVARLIDEVITDCRYIYIHTSMHLGVMRLCGVYYKCVCLAWMGPRCRRMLSIGRLLTAKVAEPRHGVEKVIFEAGHKFPLAGPANLNGLHCIWG